MPRNNVEWFLPRSEDRVRKNEVPKAEPKLAPIEAAIPDEAMLAKWKTLYAAPFYTDEHGLYIWDANHNMIAQPRGWGRISNNITDQKEAAKVQIAFCNLMVQLLNSWCKGE